MTCKLCYTICCVLLLGCNTDQKNRTADSSLISFKEPKLVKIAGYNGHAMEPFIWKDSLLFFNNLNEAPENTNIHWAIKINDTNFLYKGEIGNINSGFLEGVPTADTTGNLYFVSNRSYQNSYSVLYGGRYSNGAVSDVHLIKGVSLMKPGHVNFDVEISEDGGFMYFVDGRLGENERPLSADIVIAKKSGTGFVRLKNTDWFLQHINSNELEYAACISADQLELYFTRLSLPIREGSKPELYYATREQTIHPFHPPQKITAINGFAEAPTITSDQRKIYFHMRTQQTFEIYLLEKN